MFRLMITADDFTGALDTGVQLSKAGVPTLVSASCKFPPEETAAGLEVLVLDLETRHLPPEKARERVRKAALMAQEAGVPYIYKKTDSGMRGNIGSELEGLFATPSDGPVAFVPAYPETGRTTRGGMHYSGGVPITQTVFGSDPFTPVLDDYIPDIIARQTGRAVQVVAQEDLERLEELSRPDSILVFDAEDAQQMRRVADAVAHIGPPRLMAGCAGFAAYLPNLLKLTSSPQEQPALEEGLLVVCGSINRLTLEQIDYATGQGFTAVELTPEQKLADDLACSDLGQELLQSIQQAYRDSGRVILQAASGRENIGRTDRLAAEMGLDMGQARERIADNMGRIIGALTTSTELGTLAVFGGDTLMAVMRSVGEDGIAPVGEIQSGIVHSVVTYQGARTNLITKSGGFGSRDSILKIEQYIRQHAKQKEGTRAHV